jgi:hypothetical protein
LHSAIESAQRYLNSRQSEEGFWGSELNGDATLESDAVMLMHYLGDVDKDRQRRLLNYVLSQQNADGGWSIYRGGPSDPNATLKAYFALRLAGFTHDDAQVRKAHHKMLELGGVEVCNSYNEVLSRDLRPVRLEPAAEHDPGDHAAAGVARFLNIYRISAWTRTIVVPMLILYALRPSVKVNFSIRDLHLPYDPPGAKSLKNAFWRSCFKFLDRAMGLYNRLEVRWIRRRALQQGRGVDAGAQQAAGRPGRDLPAHAQHDHGPARARLLEGLPRVREGAARVPRPRGPRRAGDRACSPASPRSGTPRGPSTRSPAAPTTSPSAPRRAPTGCSRSRSSRAATGR